MIAIVCKIILTILLFIKSVAMIIDATMEDKNWKEKLIKAFLYIPIVWLLCWGAGLLDF